MGNGIAAFLMLAAFQAVPAQVRITPERAEIEVTETTRLAARAVDGAGRALEGVDVR